MLQPPPWVEELDDPEEEPADPQDDLDLEFMLYSQLHYEQADELELVEDGGTLSVCAPQTFITTPGRREDNIVKTSTHETGGEQNYKSDIKTISLLTFSENSVQQVNCGTLGKSDLKGSKKASPSKVKTMNDTKLDHSIHETIVIDSESESSSDSIAIGPVKKKPRRQERVMVEEDSVLDPSTSFISSDTCDSSDGSSFSADVSGSGFSDSESCSSLDTPHLSVHMDFKQSNINKDVNCDKWKINEEDRLAGIAGNSGTSGKRFGGTGIGGRYYRPSSVKCFNCNEIGHLSKDCPKPQKSQICILCGITGHYFRDCPQSLCYNCNQPGHTAKECTLRKQWRYQECQRCCMTGHSHQDCPDRWRQFHMTKSSSKPCPVEGQSDYINSRRSCYNCSSKKHFGFECPKDRIDRYSMPTYPMIARYDKWKVLKMFFTGGDTGKQKTLKEKRKLKKMKVKNKVQSLSEPERMVKPSKPKTKKSKKQKHNWDSKFSAFSDTGKPVKLSKKKKKRANLKQWKQGSSDQKRLNANGFRLSSFVQSTQRKMTT